MSLMQALAKERFGMEAARELCRLPGIFQPGEVCKREAISEKSRSKFVSFGGSRDTTKQAVSEVIRSWLGRENSPFEKLGKL